jgi:hypothetical protein
MTTARMSPGSRLAGAGGGGGRVRVSCRPLTPGPVDAGRTFRKRLSPSARPGLTRQPHHTSERPKSEERGSSSTRYPRSRDLRRR